MSLLLVISCNPTSKLKDNGMRGAGIGVKRERAAQNDKDALKGKLKALLIGFGLSDEEKQIVYKIQEVLTNPDIGSGEDIKTYTDPEFYKLLEKLGALKIKGIVDNYLKVSDLQNEVKNAFNQAINNIADPDLKAYFQSKLASYQDGYALQLKKLFKDDNANVVYDAVTNGNYVAQVTRETKDHLNELRDMMDLYFGLDPEERGVIDRIRKLVTPSSVAKIRKPYKLRTVQEFFYLLNQLGVSKVKEIASVYRAYEVFREEGYKEISKSIERVDGAGLRSVLQQDLKYSHETYEVDIRGAFTKVMGGKVTDGSPNADDVYESVKQASYTSIFDNIKKEIQAILNYDAMARELKNFQVRALAYMISNIRQSELYAKILLSNLDVPKLKEIANFHTEIIESEDTAKKALASVADIKKKEALQVLFEQCVKDYHDYLELCFKQGKADFTTFYNKIMSGAYSARFNSIKSKALDLS